MSRNYSETEMAAVKTELMTRALEALIRNMPQDESAAIQVISNRLGVSLEVVHEMLNGDTEDNQAEMLVAVAKEYDVKMWRHTFIPSAEVCKRTLDMYYEQDSRMAKTNRKFKFWDRSIKTQRVRN